ncbi:MAG: hypothetical protein FWD13_00135 [Treponema sp.]|nr:hypothetical protein [Treponema sp.]
MREVNVELTLKNGADIIRASKGTMTEQNVRSVVVNAIVDTGAMLLVIGDELRRKLGLEILESRTVALARGSTTNCSIAGPVEIHWKNRKSFIRPMVLPNEKEVLLGVIPLEEMDLMVDPVNNTLVGVHGDEIISRLK